MFKHIPKHQNKLLWISMLGRKRFPVFADWPKVGQLLLVSKYFWFRIFKHFFFQIWNNLNVMKTGWNDVKGWKERLSVFLCINIHFLFSNLVIIIYWVDFLNKFGGIFAIGSYTHAQVYHVIELHVPTNYSDIWINWSLNSIPFTYILFFLYRLQFIWSWTVWCLTHQQYCSHV